jgi:hypothetical protein
MPMLDSTNRGFDFEWSHVFLACVFVVQALNNWGLALQELGAIVPLKEKRAIVKKGIRKFRAAIQLRFDFHRAVYNLGTVLVSRSRLSSKLFIIVLYLPCLILEVTRSVEMALN